MHHGFHAFNTHEPGLHMSQEGGPADRFEKLNSGAAEVRPLATLAQTAADTAASHLRRTYYAKSMRGFGPYWILLQDRSFTWLWNQVSSRLFMTAWLQNPWVFAQHFSALCDGTRRTQIPVVETNLVQALTTEARLRLLSGLKRYFHNKRAEGLLSGKVRASTAGPDVQSGYNGHKRPTEFPRVF